MLKLYLNNFTNKIKISSSEALDSVLEQALDIFNELPENDGSYLGIISKNNIKVQITKYNKFVWIVEIPIEAKKGYYQIFYTKNRCISLIEQLYKGFNPLKINGLIFEKNNF